MFLKPEDIPKIPSSLRITHDNVNFYIYLSTGKLTCFQCNQEGHLAKHCQQKNDDISPSQDHHTNVNNSNTNEKQKLPDTEVETTEPADVSNEINNDNRNEEFPALSTNPNFKRPHAPSSESTITSQEKEKGNESNLKKN